MNHGPRNPSCHAWMAGLGITIAGVTVAALTAGAPVTRATRQRPLVTPAAGQPSPVAGQQALRSFASRPLYFEPNRGQTDPRVRFLARGPGYQLFLRETEAVFAFDLPGSRDQGASSRKPDAAIKEPRPNGRRTVVQGGEPRSRPAPGGRERVVRMRIVGANPHASI